MNRFWIVIGLLCAAAHGEDRDSGKCKSFLMMDVGWEYFEVLRNEIDRSTKFDLAMEWRIRRAGAMAMKFWLLYGDSEDRNWHAVRYGIGLLANALNEKHPEKYSVFSKPYFSSETGELQILLDAEFEGSVKKEGGLDVCEKKFGLFLAKCRKLGPPPRRRVLK